jgi:lipopolysaccharide biosynthesis glycosyltransferase
MIDSNNTESSACTIALAADDNFFPHMGTLIVSILENRKKNRFFEFYVLDGGISHKNRMLLQQCVLSYKNTAINHINTKSALKKCMVRKPFTQDSYSRLLLDTLLPNHEKVLYLDSDMIVEECISSLYDINVDSVSIAAVFDYIMHYFCRIKTRSTKETGGIEARDYLMNCLDMGDAWKYYFQSGTLLFNLKKIREKKLFPQMIEKSKIYPYWYIDQDLLNQYLYDDVLLLDARWNVVNMPQKVIDGLSFKMQNEIQQAMHQPSIIHFAGWTGKPWNNPEARFSDRYWEYLQKTPWLNQVKKPTHLLKMDKNGNFFLRFFKRFSESIRKRYLHKDFYRSP